MRKRTLSLWLAGLVAATTVLSAPLTVNGMEISSDISEAGMAFTDGSADDAMGSDTEISGEKYETFDTGSEEAADTVSEDTVSADTVSADGAAGVDELFDEDAVADDTLSDNAALYLSRIVDPEGNEYDEDHPLVLHVGESKRLGLRYIKNDSTGKTFDIWNMEDMAAFKGVDFVIDLPVYYTLVSKNGLGEYKEEKYGVSVDKIRTGDTLDEVSIYLKGLSQNSVSGNLFLKCRILPDYIQDEKTGDWTEIIEDRDIYIPIGVEDAESGVTYEDPERGYICETRREALDAVREIIRNRTNNSKKYGFDNSKKNVQNAGYPYNNYVYDRVYVRSDVFEGRPIDLNLVADFEREREDMKPWEGDYIIHCIGDSKRPVSHWEYPASRDLIMTSETDDNGSPVSYNVYEVYLPFMTTKAEEDAVDKKIAQLMATTFAKVKDGTDAQKIKAVYDYIRGHVSGTVKGAGGSDRTFPKYHTAYHALIKGNGTCEAYAMLFTRLTRELGVPSKVILGVDSNNHTYNIVRNGSYWYYIDCSTGRYLSDAKSFSRAKEQSKFTTQAFINSYLSKVKNASFKSKKTGWSAVSENGEKIETTEVFMDLRDQLNEKLRSYPDSHWTVKAEGDVVLTDNDNFSFDPNGAGRVSLDLQGHTMTVKNHDLWLTFEEIKNGTIYLPNEPYISYCVQVGFLNYQGDPFNIRVKDIAFKGPSKGYGSVRLQGGGQHYNIVLDNVTGDRVAFDLGDCERNNFKNGDHDRIMLEGDLSLSNSYFYGWSMGYDVSGNIVPLPVHMNIVRYFDNPGDTVPSKQGRFILKNVIFGQCMDYGRKEPMTSTIELYPIDVMDGNIDSGEFGRFRYGDSPAEASGTQRVVAQKSQTKVVACDPDEMIKVPDGDTYVEPGVALVYDEPDLVLAKSSIRLKAFDKDGNETGVTEHATFNQAVKAMTKDRGSAFEMELLNAAHVRKNTTIPTFVTDLSVRRAYDADVSANTVFDLGGKTLNCSGSFKLDEGVSMESIGGTGTLNLGKSKGKVELYGYGTGYADNVKILASKGSVILNNISGNAVINAAGVTVPTDSFATTSGVTATTLDIGDEAVLASESVTAANASLGVDSRLAADVLKVSKVLNTGSDSVTAVNKSATLAAVTIGGMGASLLKLKDVSGNEALITINGKISRASGAESAKLGVGIIDRPADENSDYFTASTGMAVPPSSVTKLFAAKSAPTEGILEIAKRQGSVNRYEAIYHESGIVWAGRECIDLDGTKYVKWSDAAKKIAAINDNADHVLTFTEDVYAVGGFKMPKKAGSFKVKGAVGEGEDKSPARVYYTGNISLTTDTVLEDLKFIQGSGKTAAVFAPLNPYRIMTLEMTGHSLSVAKDVSFSVPVKINDKKKKGTLTLEEGARIRAVGDAEYLGGAALESATVSDSVIVGGISGVSSLIIKEGQNLIISDRVAGAKSGAATKYAAPVFNVKNLDLKGGLTVTTVNADIGKVEGSVKVAKAASSVSGKAKAIITNAELGGGARLTSCALQITNMTLEGSPRVEAAGNFNVTGKLVSKTADAEFVTFRKNAGKKSTPYLAVNGTVELSDPSYRIGVVLKDAEGSYYIPDGGYVMDREEGYTGMLFTAKKADVSKFAIAAESGKKKTGTMEPVGAYSDTNKDGWLLSKKGTGVYVFYGDEAVAKVTDGEGFTGYYISFAEAVAGINALGAKKDYTIALMQDVGGNIVDRPPVKITMPAAKNVNSLTVTSFDPDAMKSIYYTNTITLTSDTVIKNVILSPVKKTTEKVGRVKVVSYPGTTLPIKTGKHDLTIKDILNGDGSEIGKITGSGEGDILLDQSLKFMNGQCFLYTGDITRVGSLTIKNYLHDTDEPNKIQAGFSVRNIQADNVNFASGDIFAGYNSIKAKNMTVGEDVYLCMQIAGTTLVSDTLTMEGGVKMYVGLAGKDAFNVTIGNIVNNGTKPNTIDYLRGKMTANDPQGRSALSIKGKVMGNNPEPIHLSQASYNPALLTCEGTGSPYKVVTKPVALIANVPVAPTSAFVLDEFSSPIGSTAGCTLIKAGGGLYYADATAEPFKNAITVVSYNDGGKTVSSNCLDWAEAVKEVGRIGDPAGEYTLNILAFDDGRTLRDTVLTDNNKYGALTLPAVNKAAKITVSGGDTNATPTAIECTGNMTGYGSIAFDNVQLSLRKGVNNDADGSAIYTGKKNTSAGAQDAALAFRFYGAGIKPEARGTLQVKGVEPVVVN